MTNATTQTTLKHGELNLRKVERTAKAGDYVVFKGISEGYGVTTGKPYAVHGEARYIDNDGSNMDVYGWNHSDPNPDIYEAFEEPSNKLAGLRKVTGRKAAAGDFVVFKKSHNGTPQGEPFEVLSDDDSYNSHTHRFTINGWGGSEQYDLYEEVPAPKKGDTVKILGMSKYGLNYIGKTGVVDTVNFFDQGWTAVDPTEGGPTGLYLPEHLELIEEEKTMTIETSRTFKVGDKVRVIAAANGRYGDLFDGAEGIIDDIYSGYLEMYRVHSDAADDYDRFEAKDIELIVDSPVEFKVGDYVEVLDASKGLFGDQRDGARGTIDHIAESQDGIRVVIDGDIDRYPASALRKVASEPVAKVTVESSAVASASFKEGDKVRMISTNPNHGFGEVKTGDIGTVQYATERLVTVNFPAQSFWNGIASEFELIPEATAAKAAPTFEVGDVIRITDISQIEGAYWITEGKTYEIVEIDEDGDIQILDNYDDEFCIVFAEFGGIEKVEATPVEDFDQFQPGDRVVIVSGGGVSPLWGFDNGAEYEVRDNNYENGRGRRVSLKKANRFGATGFALPSQLKLVAAAVKGPKFSAGDKAILTSDDDDAATMGFRIGDEVTIVGTSCGMNDYEIVREGARGYASDRHLTAVEAPETRGGLTVGDTVQVAHSPGFHLFRFKVGEIATVTGFREDGYVWIQDEEGKREHMQPGQVVKHEAAPALKEGDFIEIDFDFEGHFLFLDLTKGKSYEVVPSKFDSTKLSIVDDVGDTRTKHIEQGAYTIVDAPAVAEVVAKAYQFVAGDYVRFTGADKIDCAGGLLTNGKVYEVVREDEPGFMIMDDEGDELYIGGYESEHYEKVDAPTRKLQVGDIVRLLTASGVNNKGDIGVITTFDYDKTFRVDAGRGTTSNWADDEMVELIVANENREDTK